MSTSSNYHDDFSCVSKTMLSLFLHSRQEYYLTYVTRQMPPKQPTKVMLAGQVLHAVLLEDKRLDDIVMVYPASCLKSDGSLNGSPAARFRDDYPGFICVKDSERDQFEVCINSVLGNRELGSVLTAAKHREQRFDAEVCGVKCRAKPDIVCDMGKYAAVYDLKFSEQVDPDSWRRTSKRLHYWLQDSHYSAVLNQSIGKPVQFRFALIEVNFPFRVQWKWYDPKSREDARDAHRKILHDLSDCHRTGKWSDNWQEEMVLEPWDIEQDELIEVEQ